MLLDVDSDNNKIFVSYYNKEGTVSFKEFNTPLWSWYVCGERDYNKHSKIRNWDGRAVKKVPSKYFNKLAMIEFLHNLPEKDQKEIFEPHFPKVYFVDIETEVTDGFPHPEQANNKVTSIAISTPNKEVIVLAIKDINFKEKERIGERINKYLESVDENFKFVFQYFKTEYDMMYTFIHKFLPKFPMVTGWNFIKFDWLYIVNRCKHLGIDPRQASPTEKLRKDDYIPCHIGMLDYMDMYRKWDRTVDVKENFKLDTAANAVLGLKKVKYNGTLQDLYEKDYEKFIFYNAIDTILVQLIHEKLRTMEIVLTLSNMCMISLYKAESPVTITESLLLRKFLDRGLVMARDFTDQAQQGKKEQYTGAYVKQPIVGMHIGVACFDFASLYPSIMRQFNVSPESFLKKVHPSKEKEEREANPTKIVSCTGAVYEKEASILKNILDELYANRKSYKKISFSYELEVDKIEHIIERKKKE